MRHFFLVVWDMQEIFRDDAQERTSKDRNTISEERNTIVEERTIIEANGRHTEAEA